MGDAFNWEWIVSCAQQQNAGIVIVSRDADYGITFNKKTYINDHLRHEFSERVSKKRGLHLYDSLSSALKEHFAVIVSKDEESAEQEISTLKPTLLNRNWAELLKDFEWTSSSAMVPALTGSYDWLTHLGTLKHDGDDDEISDLE